MCTNVTCSIDKLIYRHKMRSHDHTQFWSLTRIQNKFSRFNNCWIPKEKIQIMHEPKKSMQM